MVAFAFQDGVLVDVGPYQDVVPYDVPEELHSYEVVHVASAPVEANVGQDSDLADVEPYDALKIIKFD